MEIKLPNINEYNEVNELAKQVHKLHVNWRPDIFIDVEEVMPKEYFDQLIENKEIYVARIDNEIVGYVIFNIKERNNPSVRCQKQVNIGVLVVKEGYRGKGIGTNLLDFVKEYAKSNGCTDLYLTVNEENKNAISLYEKYGFKVKNIAYSMKIDL